LIFFLHRHRFDGFLKIHQPLKELDQQHAVQKEDGPRSAPEQEFFNPRNGKFPHYPG